MAKRSAKNMGQLNIVIDGYVQEQVSDFGSEPSGK